MSKLTKKITGALKSDKTKRIENSVRFALKKAEEHYNKDNYEFGYKYFKVASRNYEKLNKKDEELEMLFNSVTFAYSNRGEPIN